MTAKIGIVGVGVVGRALYDALAFKLDGYDDLRAYDPVSMYGSRFDDVLDTDIVFLCVPTPTKLGGRQDLAPLRSTLNKLRDVKYSGTVVAKSTVLPTNMRQLIREQSRMKIVANPEFLRTKTAYDDTVNQKMIVVGADSTYGAPLSVLYRELWPNAALHEMSPEAAMLVKYWINCELAVRVALASALTEAHANYLASHDEINAVLIAVGEDSRMGDSHRTAPGSDQQWGFGGKCFPKDLNAMARHLRVYDHAGILDAAWKYNLDVREKHDW